MKTDAEIVELAYEFLDKYARHFTWNAQDYEVSAQVFISGFRAAQKSKQKIIEQTRQEVLQMLLEKVKESQFDEKDRACIEMGASWCRTQWILADRKEDK